MYCRGMHLQYMHMRSLGISELSHLNRNKSSQSASILILQGGRSTDGQVRALLSQCPYYFSSPSNPLTLSNNKDAEPAPTIVFHFIAVYFPGSKVTKWNFKIEWSFRRYHHRKYTPGGGKEKEKQKAETSPRRS